MSLLVKGRMRIRELYLEPLKCSMASMHGVGVPTSNVQLDLWNTSNWGLIWTPRDETPISTNQIFACKVKEIPQMKADWVVKNQLG